MTDTNTRSNGDFGIDGNVVADQTLGFGGTIAFGVADEAFTGVAQSAATKAATTAVGIGFTVAMALLHQSVEGFTV